MNSSSHPAATLFQSLWGRAGAAWVIAVGLLGLAIALVGDLDRARELVNWIGWLTVGLLAWFVAGPMSAYVLGRRFV